MICLILIMTIVFINGTESTEQKIKHPDTLLQEEDMNAKTKIWLLMVEAGKEDQEELKRITPKSIFIAPLLTSRAGQCKEGYKHNHLGQCVKVIKIDPKVQLELLLQRLNQLYGGKKEQKEELKEEEPEQEQEEGKKEETEVSNGPLHFSLPISNIHENTEKEHNETKLENSQKDFNSTDNISTQKTETLPEFIPIPLPMLYQNQTEQVKDIESSGAGSLNVTEPIEASVSELEGSGEEPVGSGDDFREEETTTSLPVGIFSEEGDYLDMTETDTTTISETDYTVTPPLEEVSSIKSEVEDVSSATSESYQNTTETPSVHNISAVLSKENIHVQKEIIVENNSNSDRIVFPSDDYNRNDALRTPVKSSSSDSSRIRFPDEIPQPQIPPSYHSYPDLNSKPNKYPIHSSAMSQEQFWWLPKYWEVDENQPKSPLVKVWSRLPLIPDISYSRETPDGFRKSGFVEQRHTPQAFNTQHKDKEFSVSLERQQSPSRMVKPFRSSRFQDIMLNQRQHFRLQR